MDALSLFAAVREARETLVGRRLTRVRVLDASSLVLQFGRGQAAARLVVSADPRLPRFHLAGAATGVKPRGGLAEALASRAEGRVLEAVLQEGTDRAVRLVFGGGRDSDGCVLAAELTGRAANLVLLSLDPGSVVSALHPGSGARRLRAGDPYAPPPRRGLDPLLAEEPADLLAAVGERRGQGLTLADAVGQAVPALAGPWATELCHRAGIGGGEVPEGWIDAFWRALGEVRTALVGRKVAPRIILDDAGRPAMVSPLPWSHLAAERQVPAPTVSDAVQRLAADLLPRLAFSARRGEVVKALRAARDRVERRIAHLERDRAEAARADEWKAMGQALLANRAAVPRGATLAELPDYSGLPGGTLRIPLDPALSGAENAGAYFRRHRKAKRSTGIVEARLAEARELLSRLEGLGEAAEGASGLADLEAIEGQVERLDPRPRPATPSAAREARARPAGSREGGARRFLSSDDLPILVGRDNRGNDELTLKVARPQDLWLHAEDRAGSHVVVQLPRGRNVPRRTLIEAAALAAYYSQARGEAKVPVSYTLRKYVRKPKGAKPGLVALSHEKTILATPDPALVRRLAEGARRLPPEPPPAGRDARPAPARYAAIDIGTNTVRLLVGEARGRQGFRPAHEEQVITRLGEGLLPAKRLRPEPIQRTVAVLQRFARTARRLGAREIAATATSAVREAENRREFLDAAKQDAGLEVRVIEGDEEARLTLLGVRCLLREWPGAAAVMDVGGGSTEFILSEDGTPGRLVSTGLGVVKLTERFLRHDPPAAEEIAALEAAVADRLGRLGQEMPDLAGRVLVGTAGTVTTLAMLDLRLPRYDGRRVNGHRMAPGRMRALQQWLGGMTIADRKALPGLEPGRADVIVAGASLVAVAMETLLAPVLVVSDGGLREGILLDLLARRSPGGEAGEEA